MGREDHARWVKKIIEAAGGLPDYHSVDFDPPTAWATVPFQVPLIPSILRLTEIVGRAVLTRKVTI